MKILFGLIIGGLLAFIITLIGCTGITHSVSTKDNIIIKDSLELRGDCVITGKVVDYYTNKPLRGANVVVTSNPKGAATDLYGQFDIMNLPPGIYTLQIFAVGYNQKVISDIEVKPDRLIKLEIKLEPKKYSD